ncbi:MAG: hypothetical protein ACXVDZ_04335 [Bacteroidia bacterium]
MHLIIDFLCQNLSPSVENYYSQLLWDLGKDYVLPIILASGAAYMAYYIFVKETKRDKTKEDERKKQDQIDKLFFFSTLVGNAIDSAVQQKDNIKEHIRNVKKDDVNFHIITWISVNDIRRITQELNLEEYLLAYTNYYDGDRKATVKEFMNIISGIDYLQEVFEQIPNSLELAQKYDDERKTTIASLFAKSYNLLGDLFIYLQQNSPSEYAILNEIMKKFHENKPDDLSKVEFYNEYFFIPINDFCVKNLKPEEQILEQFKELAILTRDCKQTFNQIKFENNRINAELFDDFKTICKTIKDLNEYSKRILEI